MAAAQFTFTDDEWVDPELRVFFGSPETDVKLKGLAERYSLSPDATAKFRAVVRDIAIGKIADEDVAEELSDRAGLDYDAALDLQGDLWSELLVDVADLLEKQVSIYHDLHGEEFLEVPPAPEDATTVAVGRVMESSGIAANDAVQRKRLESALVAFMKDVRDEAETLDTLTRPSKTGGLGFTPEQSAELIASARGIAKDMAKITEDTAAAQAERAAAEQKARELREKTVRELTSRFSGAMHAAAPTATQAATIGAPASAKDDLQAQTAQEAKEIAMIAADAPETFAQSVTSASTLDDAVASAIEETASGIAGDDAMRRYRMLVSLYFRDLRDGLETKSKFTMPAVSGGMGMTDADADRVMSTLSTRANAFKKGEFVRAVAAKTAHVAARAEVHLNEADVRARDEQARTDESVSALLRKAGLEDVTRPAAAPAATAPKIIPVISMSAAKAVPVAVSGGAVKPAAPVVVPASPPSAAPVAPPVVTPPAPPTPAPPSTFKIVEPPINLPVAPIEEPAAPVVAAVSVASTAAPKPVAASAPVALPPAPKPVPPPAPSPAPTAASRPIMPPVVSPPPAPKPLPPP
ncbi:MAG: hypothetical protein RLZZ324_768, partial [Candidatus Parcubacteria bacterium]